jgi:hypothetical protein
MVGEYWRGPDCCGSRLVAGKPSAADGSGRADVESRSIRAAPAYTIVTVGTPQAMNEYRRRLERTQIKFCVLLILLPFTGLLILPRIGQVVWIAIIAAIYIRVTLVIARRPRAKITNGSNRHDARARRIFIADPKGASRQSRRVAARLSSPCHGGRGHPLCRERFSCAPYPWCLDASPKRLVI